MPHAKLTADRDWFTDANGSLLSWDECPGIDLVEGNSASARRFWATTLVLASSDHAETLSLIPSRGEDCLFATVDGIDYPLESPAEMQRWLIRAGRDLLAGSVRRSKLWWWKARFLRRPSSAPLTLEFWSNVFEWQGTYSREGIVFARVPSPK